MGIGFVKTGRF